MNTSVALAKHRQFILFLLTGGFAAAVNFGSRFIFNLWVPFSVAIMLAYLCGMITAFVLNRLFVFRQANNALHHQLFWFCIVNLAAVLQTLLVSLILADSLFPRVGFAWHPHAVAHAIGVALPVISSYVGHKHLSFRNR